MSTTVPLAYPVYTESGLVDFALGEVITAADVDGLKDAVTHHYAYANLHTLQWSSINGRTIATTSYEDIARSTWRLSGDRRRLTITGYGDTVTLRVRIYQSDGTTLLATSEDASGSPGTISGSITSGITTGDIVVDISAKCTSGSNQTLYRYAIIEQPLTAATLP